MVIATSSIAQMYTLALADAPLGTNFIRWPGTVIVFKRCMNWEGKMYCSKALEFGSIFFWFLEEKFPHPFGIFLADNLKQRLHTSGASILHVRWQPTPAQRSIFTSCFLGPGGVWWRCRILVALNPTHILVYSPLGDTWATALVTSVIFIASVSWVLPKLEGT